MTKMRSNKIAYNASMLMLLNIAKMVFPFLTLPYLTRVLSVEAYGVVAYVKAVMNYMQIIVDFGFILSATKLVAQNQNDKMKLGLIIGNNILAKLILAGFAGIFLIIFSINVPILKENMLYVLLSFLPVIMTIFLLDFFFRGIEKMQIITVRFIVMKGISTAMTFALVRDDSTMLLIPILDLLGSVAAVLLVLLEVKKLGIKIRYAGLKACISSLKESFVYFMSNIASTTFNVFNTLVSGIVLSAVDVAYWSVTMQIVNAVQALYTPISDAIYPEMIKNKNISVINKTIKIFTPIIIAGCIMVFLFADLGLYILGGEKYVNAAPILKCMIPVMFFGFLSVIYGWPALGAIGKVKEVTITTIIAAIFHIVINIILIYFNRFNLVNMAITRSITEFVLFSGRFLVFYRNKNFVRQ